MSRWTICASLQEAAYYRTTHHLPLPLYFFLVFVFAWAFWFCANAVTTPAVRWLLLALGVFTPGLVALWMTYRQRGAGGVGSLLARLVQWDIGGRWLAFALLFMATVKVLVALIVRVSTGAWPVFGDEAIPLMFVAAIFSTLVGGQIGEELGWRGFALPRMAASVGLAPASVMLGVIWAVWHAPLFFVTGTDKTGQSFPFFALQVIGSSVALAWLFMKTNGSLFATMLLHAAINNTKDIVPSALPTTGDPWQLRASPAGWSTVAVLWLFAAMFLFDMRRDTTVARVADAG
jgi:membrane protease YdiL (CAAX protease family)